MFKKNITSEKNSKTFTIIGLLAFGVFAVALILLMFWTIITTLKSTNEFRNNNLFGLPEEWSFKNYLTAISYFKVHINRAEGGGRYVGILEMLLNTVLYAGIGTLMYVLCHYIVAYCTASFNYKFSRFIYALVLVVMIIPIVGDAAARIQLLHSFNMYDNWLGFFFQRFGFTGLHFLIMYETIKAVPKEMAEAARIDGASEFRIMSTIILPIVAGMVGAIFLITFIAQWNEFQYAIMYMPSHPTLSYGLFKYNREAFNEVARSVPLQLSGCVIILLPILALFICFRKKIMGNLSLGGVKE
jgi:ABC-type glycerol-3-phosphate transport system permease component